MQFQLWVCSGFLVSEYNKLAEKELRRRLSVNPGRLAALKHGLWFRVHKA